MRDKPHKRLDLWGKTMELVLTVYNETKMFPREEEFGLKGQMRRAVVSVPSNISEGLTRTSKKDKLHFLNIAQGSLSELDAQLDISEQLNYLTPDRAARIGEVQTSVESLLSGLIRSLRQ
ncbi:MAG TPA: four helix bundle protein [Bacteroidota bacterium]|nr:four helix bundle protein [Bacteroidota bacterium]